MWQPIETYPFPTEEYDVDHPEALFYEPNHGIVIARCILFIDEGEKEYKFYYHDGWYLERPTHWMPLPKEPEL